MSLDSRSLERLRALGRKLPEKISEPERPITPKATEARHRVETEKNPDALFHELMQVSEDGTVPTHFRDITGACVPCGPLSVAWLKFAATLSIVPLTILVLAQVLARFPRRIRARASPAVRHRLTFARSHSVTVAVLRADLQDV